MTDRVLTDIDGAVAHVRLNRADKRNALDPAMFAGIVEAGEALKGRRDLRAVVLSGEGASFCAGLDFSSFQAMAGNGDAGAGTETIGSIPAGRITHLGQQAAWVWHELEIPVIVAVHGHALGGGLQLTLGADIRIVHPDAQLSVLEIRWGLTPDMIATYVLPRLVGVERAKELTWTGRMVTGSEAVAMGLCSRLSATPVDDALALAHEIAGKSPQAIRGAKALLDASLDASAAEQFAMERKTIGSLIGSPDQVEAVTAFFEKRPPQFRDGSATESVG